MVMGLFKKFQGDITNRMSGKTDLLEAVAAGAMLVAYADNNADDGEIATAIAAVKANKALSAAFSQSIIERTMDTMYDRAKGGRSGRAGLYKEIEDVAGKPDDAEVVMYAILDVADNDGISPEEKAVLSRIATSLRMDLNKFM